MRRACLALVLTLAVCAAACGPRSREHAAVATPTPVPLAHIEVRGAIAVSHDATVKNCYVGKPGKKLLSGYSVTFQTDKLIDGAEVLVPMYAGDRTYSDSSSLILNVAPGPGFPHGTTLEDRPQARLSVTLSAGGRSGRAVFENYHTLYGAKGDERGGLVSGTVEWTCPQIERGQ